MGNWNITIRGTGSHHNKGYAKDANRMVAAGHDVHEASITHGGADQTLGPVESK